MPPRPPIEEHPELEELLAAMDLPEVASNNNSPMPSSRDTDVRQDQPQVSRRPLAEQHRQLEELLADMAIQDGAPESHNPASSSPTTTEEQGHFVVPDSFIDDWLELGADMSALASRMDAVIALFDLNASSEAHDGDDEGANRRDTSDISNRSRPRARSPEADMAQSQPAILTDVIPDDDEPPKHETCMKCVLRNPTYTALQNATLRLGTGKKKDLEDKAEYECGICTETIQKDQVVLGHRGKCSLQVHADCVLGHWLRVHRTCPNCRDVMRPVPPPPNLYNANMPFYENLDHYVAAMRQQGDRFWAIQTDPWTRSAREDEASEGRTLFGRFRGFEGFGRDFMNN